MNGSDFVFGDNGDPFSLSNGSITDRRIDTDLSNGVWTDIELDTWNVLSRDFSGEIEAELPIPNDDKVHFVGISASTSIESTDTIQFYDEDRSINGITHSQWLRLSGSAMIGMWIYNRAAETWIKL